MLEHKNQIYLSRIIRQILLNLFSVALIQRLLHDLLTGASPPTAMREPRLHIILITQSLSYVDSTSNTAWFKNYRASKFVECPCNLLHNYVIICFMIIKLWIVIKCIINSKTYAACYFKDLYYRSYISASCICIINKYDKL